MFESSTASYRRPSHLDYLVTAGAIALGTAAITAENFDLGYNSPLFRLESKDLAGPIFGIQKGSTTYSQIQDYNSTTAVKIVEKTFNDELISEIVEVSEINDGWDGAKSKAPSGSSIKGAINVAQEWPSDIIRPEPAVTIDGNVVLELYDNDGFSIGGVEFTNDGRAFFVILDDTTVVDSDYFSPESKDEILSFINKITPLLN